jgi:CHRD domain
VKRGPIGAAILTAVAVVAIGSASARPSATTITVRTTMNAADEVPAPKGEVTAAQGTFTATVTKSASGATASWQLTFSSLTGPAVAAHIHLASTGVPGPVAVPLCGPCQSPASGNANINESVLAALQSGGAYVNVHTPTNAPGEIRGQLAVSAAFTTTLTPRQEVPRPKGTTAGARGSFVATVTKSAATRLAWRLTFTRLTGRAVAAHIHVGARGRSGPVVVPLCGPCRSGARGTATLRARVIAALEAGTAYVNVHTARNAGGEIRGQIRAVPLTIS